MTTNARFRPRLLPLLLLALSTTALAATPLQEASELAAQGRHAAAEARYDAAIAADPALVAARIGRGFVRAWQKKYGAAAEDFRAVLAREPKNLEAQNGLAYTLAWSGQYDAAETEFRKSLAIAPAGFDATKGLAYVALWRGDAKTAVARFQPLTEKYPRDAELFVALGNARRATGDEANARAAYERALAIDPARADARQALASPAAKPAEFRREFELTALAGRSDFGDGTSKSGLRFAQAAVQATPSLRAWAIYDAGLSLDNSLLARRNADADAWYVGGFKTWGGNLGTRVEVGRRDLGTGQSQSMLRAEQVFFLASGWVPKAGVWLGRASGLPTESTYHAGVSIPLSSRLRVEPTVFRAENAAREREVRGLLFAEYSFTGGSTLGAGYADGRKSSPLPGADSRREVLLSASTPLTDSVRAMLQARRETGGPLPAYELIAAGVSLRF